MSRSRRIAEVVLWGLGFGLNGCSAPPVRFEAFRDTLALQSLVITEVAQSTTYTGTKADQVEVYCASKSGCDAFRACDSSVNGYSCSAEVAAMAYAQRVVVSRGTSITTSDLVWLANVAREPLAGTQVGPFECDAEASRVRRDCSTSEFAACSTPGLGESVGSCYVTDVSEPFVYKIGFAVNQSGRPETTCNRSLCLTLVKALDEANVSIDFALYGVRGQSAVIDALVRAEKRGVIVRGVVDSEDATCSKFGYVDTPTLVDALAPGSVVCDVGAGYSYIMHNKFVVIDGATVWTGSTNVSDTELGGEYNTDVAVLIASYRLAEIYEAEFTQMYAGNFHHRKSDNTEHVVESKYFEGGATVKSYFSPTDDAVKNAVLPLIEEATESIDIAMFFFTSETIADALVTASRRGVRVRLILDAGGAANPYSVHRDLCNAGIDVRIENWGGKSHSKWAIADGYLSERAAVVFGSMNYTSAGNVQNDENTLYVKHPDFALTFEAEFERQWISLSLVPSCVSISAEGADSSVCSPSDRCDVRCSAGACCDGLDNDYDGRTDFEEETCGCADGIDNDDDGYIDLRDFDCQAISIDP